MTARMKPWMQLLVGLLVLLPVTTLQADSTRHNPSMDWLPPGLDWTQAETLVVQFEDYFYVPNDLQLRRDRPYRLVLNNISDINTHDLVDLDFFHAVVLAKLNIDGVDVLTPHIHEIKLRPNSKATLYLVPKEAGEYEVFCSIPGHREEGMDGVVEILAE